MRVLMNAKDSSPGHEIGMRVWELGGHPDAVAGYLNAIIGHASRAKDDERLVVAQKLKKLVLDSAS